MARYQVAPTKSNLLRLKTENRFAQEGYELLEQKREILTVELMSLVDKARDLQKQLDALLQEAHSTLSQTLVLMGRQEVASHALGVNTLWRTTLASRKIMGITVPTIRTQHSEHVPFFSSGTSSIWLDETIRRFKKCVDCIGKFTEAKISILRLAREVHKTLRRVNALEKICLPDYQETLQYIEDALEEEERSQFAVLKLVKSRLEKKRVSLRS